MNTARIKKTILQAQSTSENAFTLNAKKRNKTSDVQLSTFNDKKCSLIELFNNSMVLDYRPWFIVGES